MRLREFIILGGTAITWPLAARAAGGGMRRMGVLTTFGDSDAQAQGWDAAFRKGLDESGWHDRWRNPRRRSMGFAPENQVRTGLPAGGNGIRTAGPAVKRDGS